MKILFVVEHFYPYVGGAEELFLNLTVSLVEAGHEVNVVTTLYDKSIKKNEEYKGVKISRINCYNRFLFTLFSLPEIIRKGRKADFIHTTSYNSAIPSFIAGLILRKKVIITFHEVWGKLWFRLPYTSKFQLVFFHIYERFILKLRFHKYIAVSDYTRKALIENGIPANKIIKIYNGIDYDLFKEYRFTPPKNFTFCFFGRLGISKGLEHLLVASKLFLTQHPNAIFKLIIPTYPEKLFRKVIRTIKQLDIERNLVLMHNLPKDKLLKEVSNSSCVIVPSYSEGFCYVAVEAGAMEVPVISSGKGSLPEVVGGQFIEIGSLDSQGIFKSLNKAIENEWDYKTPVKFPLIKSTEKYLNLYENFK